MKFKGASLEIALLHQEPALGRQRHFQPHGQGADLQHDAAAQAEAALAEARLEALKR